MVKPNEVGSIPVLMYHSVGAPGGYDSEGLNIRPETLRRQLEMMYRAGWYPVNMRDAVTAHIDVPAGKTPVVLTFDDARGSQFHYRRDGSLDPTCAVAIMEQFHARHPDWPLRATFYVLPYSKWNPVPFYQPGKETRKLNYLVQQGFEVANHSTSHRFMTRMPANTLRWEMAECVRYIKARAPGATMDTMAIPYGARPRNEKLVDVLLQGDQGGIHYENRCVLNAWGGPTAAPVSKHFDRRAILRIGSEPGYVEGWIKRLHQRCKMEPYVSDGDPNTIAVPRRAAKEVDPNRLEGARLVVYDDGTKTGTVERQKRPILPGKSG